MYIYMILSAMTITPGNISFSDAFNVPTPLSHYLHTTQNYRRKRVIFKTMSQSQIRNLIVQNMILTTPERVIKQSTTKILLDDLIDESLRTTPRRPIMMQFNPSGGWFGVNVMI